jgi:hypothetical protein
MELDPRWIAVLIVLVLVPLTNAEVFHAALRCAM